MLYWQIGQTILERQRDSGWGAKVIEQLAKDLAKAFPEMKGFSSRNLKNKHEQQKNRAKIHRLQRKTPI